MATWLDHHNPDRVATAISELSSQQRDRWTANLAHAAGDQRYALWLTMAFDRLAQYPPPNVARPGAATWRDQYLAGASPLTAAFSGWTEAAAHHGITPLLTRSPR